MRNKYHQNQGTKQSQLDPQFLDKVRIETRVEIETIFDMQFRKFQQEIEDMQPATTRKPLEALLI